MIDSPETRGLKPETSTTSESAIVRGDTDQKEAVVSPENSFEDQIIAEALRRSRAMDHSADKTVRDAKTEAKLRVKEWISWLERRKITQEQMYDLMAGALAEGALHTIIDPRTGLLNNSGIRGKLQELMVRSQRTREPLKVLFIDLVGFKAVNDTLGHSVGDEILRFTGDFLRETVRAIDPIGRIAGDEFLVGILESRTRNRKHESGQVKETVEQRITREIQEGYANYIKDRLREIGINAENIHLEARIGVAQYQYGESVHEFIDRADADMNSKRDPNKPSR